MWLDVCGKLSDIISIKNVNDNIVVMLSDTFSPASGGTKNTSIVRDVKMRHGIRIFNT